MSICNILVLSFFLFLLFKLVHLFEQVLLLLAKQILPRDGLRLMKQYLFFDPPSIFYTWGFLQKREVIKR
jgi:hypothetical protein